MPRTWNKRKSHTWRLGGKEGRQTRTNILEDVEAKHTQMAKRIRDVQHSDSEHKYSAQALLDASATSTLLDVPHNVYVVQFGAKKERKKWGPHLQTTMEGKTNTNRKHGPQRSPLPQNRSSAVSRNETKRNETEHGMTKMNGNE